MVDFRLRECTIKWCGLPYPQLAYDIEFDWMMVGNRWQPVYFFDVGQRPVTSQPRLYIFCAIW